MLKQRIITALILLPIVILSILLSKITLGVLVLVVYGVMQYEMFSFSPQLLKRDKLFLAVISYIVPLSYLLNGFTSLTFAFALYNIFCFSYLIYNIQTERHVIFNTELISLVTLACSYTALFGSILFVVAMRFESNFLIWLISISITTDTFAYFFGKYLGAKKLSPRISPNKTYVGLFGGIFGALLVGFLISYNNFIELPSYFIIILSLIMSILCIIGDLFESFVKRCYNVKDSSQILPGHGGVLDRVDALIFTAPILLILEYFLK